MKILVIDDSQFLCSLLKRSFEAAGHETSVAYSMEEGSAALEKTVPELILLDINLPDLPGPEACKVFKAHPDFKHIPVVLISGSSEDVIQQAMKDCGADGYLKKPFSPPSLLRWLQKNEATLFRIGGVEKPAAPAAAASPGPAPAAAIPLIPPPQVRSIPPAGSPQMRTPVPPPARIPGHGSNPPRAPGQAGPPPPPSGASPVGVAPGAGRPGQSVPPRVPPPAGSPSPASPLPPPGSNAPFSGPIIPPPLSTGGMRAPSMAAIMAPPTAPPKAAPLVPPQGAPAAPPLPGGSTPPAPPWALKPLGSPIQPLAPAAPTIPPSVALPPPVVAPVPPPVAVPAPPPVSAVRPGAGVPIPPAGAGPAQVPPWLRTAPPPVAPTRPPQTLPAAPQAQVVPVTPAPPPAPVGMPAWAMPQGQAAPAASSVPQPSPPAAAGDRILRIGIAEDSSFLRSVMKDTLSQLGIEVHLFGNGMDLLAQVSVQPLDLLLIDNNLPDIEGDQVCAHLKSNPGTSAMPVILMSSIEEKVLRTKAVQARADGILQKPFSPQDLIGWVKEQGPRYFGMSFILERRAKAPEQVAAEPAETEGPRLAPEEVARLIGDLKSKDKGTRLEACFQLAEGKVREAADALVEALFDVEDEVRGEAAYALGEIRDSKVIPDLLPLLSYKNPIVRERAAEALGSIGDSAATGPLVAILKSSQSDLVVLAIKALAKIGDRSAIPAIEQLVTSRNAEVVANATWALREFSGMNFGSRRQR